MSLSPTTTTINSLTPWTNLQSIPNYYKVFGAVFDKKTKTLIVFPYLYKKPPYHRETNVILKYSFSTNSWKEYKIPPTKDTEYVPTIFPATINENKIYSISGKDEILMLELMNENNKCIIKYIKGLEDIYFFSSTSSCITIVEDYIYGVCPTHVIKYNIITKKYQILREVHIPDFFCDCLIRLKDKLILFGSIDFENPIIKQYDMQNNHWESISINVPNETRFHYATTILNGQIILISATICINTEPNSMNNPSIYIYEVKTQNIRKSAISCPLPTQALMFGFHDKKKDILIIYGWIRSQIQNLPTCLKAIITKYYTNEFLHVITTAGLHYKIDTFQILNNY